MIPYQWYLNTFFYRPRQRRLTVCVLGVRVDAVLGSSNFTTASCPLSAAHDSGVRF